MNRNRCLSVFAVVLLASGGCNRTSDPAQEIEDSLAGLTPFIGTWEKEWTSYQAEWTPAETKASGTHTWKWILDKRHIQEFGQDSTGTTYQSIWSFDDDSRSFRVETVQSGQEPFSMVGEWNPSSNSLTAVQDMGDGIKLTATYLLKNKDLFEFRFLAKDQTGKVYLHLEGIGKRKTP